MPLVKRYLRQSTGPSFATRIVEHVVYVTPGALRAADKVVEPSHAQLADLAARYPEEFGARAKALGVKPLRVRRERDAYLDDSEIEQYVNQQGQPLEADDEERDEARDEDDAPADAEEEEDALEEEDDDTSGDLTVDQYKRLGAAQAAGAIAACDNQQALAGWFDAEMARKGGARRQVLDAFSQKPAATSPED